MISPMAGTSRVEIDDAVFAEQFCLMGMATDDHMNTGSRRIQVQVIQIVQQVKENPINLGHFLGRQCIGP